MKKLIIFISLLILIILFIFLRNNPEKVGINNIRNINNIIKLDIPNINGNISTTHTTNMIHASNKEINNTYDFSLINDSENINIYLNNKMAKIKKDNFFNLFDINKKNNYKKKKNNNTYNLICDDYNIIIYFSGFFKKYTKSIVEYNGFIYTYTSDSLEVKNDSIVYKFNIISNDNYKLDIDTSTDHINVYYSNKLYKKFSIMYNDKNFNVIINNNNIIISIPCEIDKYNNLEILIEENKSNSYLDYIEVTKEELLKEILKEEIYYYFIDKEDV